MSEDEENRYWLHMQPSDYKVNEALNLLQEECAEIIQIISKIRRFGFESYNPYDPSGKTNLQLLNDEVGDFESIKKYLVNAGTISNEHIFDRIAYKEDKLRKYSGLFSS